MIGQTLSHYRVQEFLGAGGMGSVWLALDTRLERRVALKILRREAVGDSLRRERFTFEAKAASALNHPSIVTVYDVGEAAGQDFIAMEYVEGKTLEEQIGQRPLPIDRALEIALQIVDALSAAHRAGIVHRDLKPSNIMVSESGAVKVLDFGLAKLVAPDEVDESAPTKPAVPRTEQGLVLGTAAYMSPEQAEGKPVDYRTDIFSIGAIAYEMLTGRRAFQGTSFLSTRMAILQSTPPTMKQLGIKVPAALRDIVDRCLAKDRERRYPSAAALLGDLHRCHARMNPSGIAALLRSPRHMVPAASLLVGLLAMGGWLALSRSRIAWAYRTALPQIEELANSSQPDAAFRLFVEAKELIDGDPELERLENFVMRRPAIETTPSGAEVYVKGYLPPEAEWIYVGRTPIETSRIPAGLLRWKISREGFETMEAAVATGLARYHFRLTPKGDGFPGMVPIPGGEVAILGASVKLDDFWLDRYEVTNQDYVKFLAAGGYQNEAFWKQPFSDGGRAISWEKGVARFEDATGRPGPAKWKLGAPPEGEERHPVGGVSWYEAAAYCEFVGKSLPSVFHWEHGAISDGRFVEQIAFVSNFGEEPVPVGSLPSLSTYGAFDMAGNLREWTFNDSGTGLRYLLGGGFGNDMYVFWDLDAAAPFLREDNIGVRCAKYESDLASDIFATVSRRTRDFANARPVNDDVFHTFPRMYHYDQRPLAARIESIDISKKYHRDEEITFDAAYGTERMRAHLLLPKQGSPPYQTVLFYPGDGAFGSPWSGPLRLRYVEFLLRTGRAVMHPLYQGMHERTAPPAETSIAYRDRVVEWAKDLSRSIDYLQTRSDIDSTRLAYYGFSRGAVLGPIFTAVESRFKASILLCGGFVASDLPEIDAVNFASRVKSPTLVIHGRYDPIRPFQTRALPLFRLLPGDENFKRLAVTDSGHFPPLNFVSKETLDWLDRHLGPVTNR